MAFNSGNTAPASNVVAFEKADGFLNFYVMDGGKKVKLGKSGLGLRTSKAIERKIIELLEADESKIGAFTGKLVVEYRSGTPVETETSFTF